MFKQGQFYLTAKGQLVKIFDSFKFQDNFTINAAVYLTEIGWQASRYNLEGKCNNGDSGYTIALTETYEKYRNYLVSTVYFDRIANRWSAKAVDPRGSTIVQLANIENPERALQLIQLGAEQKLLTWMREAGYDEDKKEVVNE